MLTGLITGLGQTGSIAWGDSHPAAQFGGGIHVWHPEEGFGQYTGHQLYIRNSMNKQPDEYWRAKGNHPMSGRHAAMIDRKIDDGNGDTGFVQSYPSFNSCGEGSDGGWYDEQSLSKDCTLQIALNP